MLPRILIAGACCAAVLAGCGDGESKGVDTAQIRSVVQQFAEADGPEACALMSPDALQDVYGGFNKPVAESRANCVRRSARFKGQKVTIQTLNVVDRTTVKVSALNPKKTVTYNVTLRKFGPSWRIDEINQAKAEE